MRFAPSRGFLHPVLGQREDYYPGKNFAVNLNCQLDSTRNSVYFQAKFELDVNAISSLIDNNTARCQVWTYCGATSYRHVFTPISDNLRIVEGFIPIDRVRGTLEFHPQIIASESIHLSLEDANDEFGNGTLALPAGSPLAVHLPSVTKLNDDDRETKAIFQLSVDFELPEGTWDIRVDIKKPTIVLAAAPQTHENFDQIRRYSGIAVPTLYLAALVETLNIYLQNPEIHGYEASNSGMWTGVINQKLNDLKLDVENIDGEDSGRFYEIETAAPRSTLWVAQRLLGDPLFNLEYKLNNDEETHYE